MYRWTACLVVLFALTAQAAAQNRDSDMVRIPGGTFTMGTSEAQDSQQNLPSDYQGWSKPQHTVTVQSFMMAKTPVTRGQYAAFVAATGASSGSSGCYGPKIVQQNGQQWVNWVQDPSLNWQNPGFTQTDNDPVVCVSYNDAMAYIAWLNARSEHTYRLPTEAEWEYAARGKANQTAAHFWGDDLASACQYANVAGTDFATAYQLSTSTDGIFSCSDGFAYTAPVASFQPNDYGLYDMLGNVWQWTADCWNTDYSNSPTDGTAATTGICQQHALRGGSWSSSTWFVQSGYRNGNGVGDRDTFNGFRLASSVWN